MAINPHPKKPGAWRIDYYPHGRKGKRVFETFVGSKAAATEYELTLRKAHVSEEEHVTPTINKIIPDYVAWIKMHRSEATVKNFLTRMNYWLPHFGDKKVSQITRVLIEEHQQSRAHVPRSANIEIMALRAVIRYMVDRGYANPLPFRIAMLPYHRPIPLLPSTDEIERFIAEIHDPAKVAMVQLMYRSGLRWKEASRIRWEMINVSDGMIVLTETKRSVQRICVIPDKALPWFTANEKKEGWVFPNPRSKEKEPYRSFKTLFMLASKRAGMKIKGPHTLRHLCGAQTIASSGNIQAVKLMLGHSDIAMSSWYAQLSSDHIKSIMKQTDIYTGGREAEKKQAG